VNTTTKWAAEITPPGLLPRAILALAVAVLPPHARARYRQELTAELYGVSDRRQLWQTITVLAHCGAFRSALTSRDVVSGVPGSRRPFLCYLHHHLRTALSPDGVPYRTCTRCGEDHYDGRGDDNVVGNVIGNVIGGGGRAG
jgi:hypothetical protein